MKALSRNIYYLKSPGGSKPFFTDLDSGMSFLNAINITKLEERTVDRISNSYSTIPHYKQSLYTIKCYQETNTI